MLSQSMEHPHSSSSTYLLLIRPVGMNNYQLIAEDEIQMQNAEPKYLIRFSLGALPNDNQYFLLGTKELIEVKQILIKGRI